MATQFKLNFSLDIFKFFCHLIDENLSDKLTRSIALNFKFDLVPIDHKSSLEEVKSYIEMIPLKSNKLSVHWDNWFLTKRSVNLPKFILVFR